MVWWTTTLSIVGAIAGVGGAIASWRATRISKRALEFEQKKYDRSINPDIEVDCKYGVLVGGYDEDVDVLSVTAKNKGEIRVILESISLELSGLP